MAPNFDDHTSVYNFVVAQGNGVKGIADLCLSEVPSVYIQPPEHQFQNQKTAIHKRAAIDLSMLHGPHHDQVVQEIVRATETLGFFQVVNHGVPLELLELLKVSAHKFFNLPHEKKALYKKGVSPSPNFRYGSSFNPEKEKALEWKDFINVIYTNHDDAQHWPNECREPLLEYLKFGTKLSKTILEILMQNLGLPPDDPRTEGLLGLRIMSMNFYPPCPSPDLTVGVGRHSDAGTLTVLLQDDIGGLQVRLENDSMYNRSQVEWLELPPIAGALVVNVGDVMQILSNGRYRSAEHKVRTTSAHSRVSVPFFAGPKLTDTIGPLPGVTGKDEIARYKEVLFADYFKNFFTNAHEGKKSLDYARVTSSP